jgi:hypothetical protein
MNRRPLESYLRDHLAGSVGALELLEHLRDGGAPPEEREFVAGLREEIVAEQRLLRSLRAGIGGSEARLRQAGAWITEKLTELKLRVDDPGDRGLRYFQALEAIALGIQGKLALYTALESVRDDVPALSGIDLAELRERSIDQHARVESRRVAAARVALRDAPHTKGAATSGS